MCLIDGDPSLTSNKPRFLTNASSFQRLPPRPSLLQRQALGLDRLPHLRLRHVLRHVRDPVAERLERRGERVERGSELVGDRGLAAALLRRRDELRPHEGAPLGRRQLLPPRLLPEVGDLNVAEARGVALQREERSGVRRRRRRGRGSVRDASRVRTSSDNFTPRQTV